MRLSKKDRYKIADLMDNLEEQIDLSAKEIVKLYGDETIGFGLIAVLGIVQGFVLLYLIIW